MGAAVLLTVQEVAELEGISENAIWKKIQRNKLKKVESKNIGFRGVKYLVELDELSAKARRKYQSRQKNSDVKSEESESRKTGLEDLTAKQREGMYEWNAIICNYNNFLHTYGKQKKKGELTKAFVNQWNPNHPEMQISESTLYRKIRLQKKEGEVALADKRGQSHWKNQYQIDETVWAVFLQWWLDEAQPCISTVYRLLQAWCELDRPDLLPLPNQQTFYRKAKTLDVSLIEFFRNGNKSFEDHCVPYLRRQYNDIDSNEIWSSDYHTLDMFVRDDVTGKVFRPHAAVWIDIRSRKTLSVVLCENSNSDGVVLAFRKAAELYGLPKKVYLDNGREFLVHDFGGRGKRKTDPDADYGAGILERCGVTMYNATVKNAKTKIIERIFRDVHNDFAKLINTYCGGRPAERPERLEKLMKRDKNIPLLSDVRRQFELYCEGIYNEHKSDAMGMNHKCPNDVYGDNLITKRMATKEQLNLLLLRSARLQKVGRNGVYLKFGETVLDYYDVDLVSAMQGQKVYVRYDIEHLGTVRVYDDQERYLCEAKLKQNGGYALGEDTNLEAIKELNHQKKQHRQSVVTKMADAIEKCPAPDKVDIMERIAQKTIDEAQRTYSADIIEPFKFAQNTYYEEEEEKADFSMKRMAENAQKRIN